VPVFAVVGHPNKGKSSLVATLAQDDRVRIAQDPGTTTAATRYPMRVDGETLYVLVDTPGFQRARGVLSWLQAEAERSGASAAERAGLVERFVRTAAHRDRFPDEVELLTPVVEGAGILYVVDGSVPYGAEYEAEMEVLRWTGRPSLAVINPIGEADHVESWRAALGQYFRVVRVFDALDGDFEKRLDLLRAFSELDEAWRDALRRAVEVLGADRAARRSRAAIEIAGLLAEATSLSVERRIGREESPEAYRASLEEEFRAGLRRLERRARAAVEAIYDFHGLDVEEGDEAEGATERALLEEDLFSRETWLVFGLRARDLVAAGAATGAAAGGTIDAALGGATVLAGAAVGGLVGGVLGWLGGGRLAKLEVLRQPLGGQRVRFGPAQGANLVAVLLGRACLHQALLASRAHARRDRVRIGAAAEESAGQGEAPDAVAAEKIDPKRLRVVMEALRGTEAPDRDALARAIEPLLA
jgi:hypothetical protein